MSKPIADITHFEVVLPKKLIKQSKAIEWMTDLHIQAREIEENSELGASEKEKIRKLYLRYGVNGKKIATRRFECEDVGKTLNPSPELIRVQEADNHGNGPSGPSLKQRSLFFAKRSQETFQKMYPKGVSPPNHLIHVSCTGYVSPSAPQHLVEQRKWTTSVTHAYHMGCYAALPAVRIAQGFVAQHRLAQGFESKNDSFSADIVHTEMCGLHINPLLNSPEQIIVQSLFADGNIKYSLKPVHSASKGFRLYHIEEKIFPNTTEQMSWVPEHWGFRMALGRDVPALVQDNVRGFVLKMFKNADWEMQDDFSKARFSIHPGGPRIIENVQQALELSDDQVKDSQDVLRERGNMSSATLPHIWKRISEQELPSGTPVISLAFGPGLTMFGALFKVI